MVAVKMTIVLTAIFVAVSASPLTQASPSRFSYLGKISNANRQQQNGHRERRSIGSWSTSQSFYFLSQNAAGWASAEADCKAFLNQSATLLYIETEEELANITRLIQNRDDTGSLYWIGGKYDTHRGAFVWNSEEEIGSWAPWQDGHPNTLVPVTRIAMYTVGTIRFQTQLETKSNRFICEMKNE